MKEQKLPSRKDARHFVTRLAAEGSGLFIEIPFDVKATFGKARSPVLVSINGYTYRSTVAVYGGRYYVPVRKDHRNAASISAGEEVKVTIAPDREPRVIEPPPELAKALGKNKRAKTRWEALSFSHKKEHVMAIEDAKRPETKKRRLERVLAELTEN